MKRNIGFGMGMSLVLAMGLLSGCKQTAANQPETVAEAATAADTTAGTTANITTAGSSSDTTDGKKLIIGRVIFDLRHPYQMADAEWFADYCEQDGHETVIMDGASNAETMQKCVEDLISRGVDGIVIQPLDSACADAVVKTANDAGMPIVTFNEKTENEVSPHVILDQFETSRQLGVEAATKWQEWYPDQPIIVGIVDSPASWVSIHINRAMAFWEGIQQVAPDARLVSELDGGAVRDQSFAAAQDMLQSNPEVNIVYGINADSVLGVLAAFEEAGRGKAENGIPLTELIVGTDGTVAEAQKIFDPNSALKITQGLRPKSNARTILDTAIKVIDAEVEQTYETSVTNQVFYYWNTTAEEFETFLVDEYFEEPGFAASVQQ